jgi:hypothetical protein
LKSPIKQTINLIERRQSKLHTKKKFGRRQSSLVVVWLEDRLRPLAKLMQNLQEVNVVCQQLFCIHFFPVAILLAKTMRVSCHMHGLVFTYILKCAHKTP